MHNPYNYLIAIRDDHTFFGREEILKRLIKGLSAPVPLSAVIFGGRRCGYTSLLGKLARMLSGDVRAAGGRRFVLCNIDLQRRHRLVCSDDVFLWVLEELGRAWELQHGLERGLIVEALQTWYRGEAARGPVDAFVCAFRSLDKRGERIRLVILIDESEHILTVEWGEDLRPNLRALLSNSPIVEDIALVMPGSPQMYTRATTGCDSPLENILVRYCLPTLSHEATLALARQPNNDRLPEDVVEEVWRQTGGQPCMAQYVLHELWEELEGQLECATVGDVRGIAETFDDRTRCFAMWAGALGDTGNRVYRFLADRDAPVTYPAIRQRFSEMTAPELQSTVDALLYHGLIHCHGRGRKRRYTVAGQMYRDWCLSAGKLGPAASLPEATRLRRILETRLSLEEFRTLCADVEVNYDHLGGEGLPGKARELILHLQNRNALPRLIDWLRQQRPDISLANDQSVPDA